MKITQLTAENIKRLSAVQIKPDGNMVVIGGRNGAGKTSVLDSIMYALAGKSSIPADVIRQGQEDGKVEVETDSGLRVVRRWTERGTTLSIYEGEHSQVRSPQKLLDSICNDIAFDPLEFTRSKPREQAETVRALLGLDFTELDAERERLYTDRTDLNRNIRDLQATIDALEPDPDTPEEMVDIDSLMAELKRCQAVNQTHHDLEAKADRLMAMRAETSAQLKTLQSKLEMTQKELEETMDQIRKTPTEPTRDIEYQITTAEAQNEKVRKARQRAEQTRFRDGLKSDADKMSARINEIDREKAQAMAEANWPIDGLGFGADGLTFHDHPFENASSAEQTRVSVAMGVAMNPELKVFLVRDGSLLDEDSMKLLAELANAYDCQFWIERVSEGAECSVVIEDGAVVREPETVGA